MFPLGGVRSLRVGSFGLEIFIFRGDDFYIAVFLGYRLVYI